MNSKSFVGLSPCRRFRRNLDQRRCLICFVVLDSVSLFFDGVEILCWSLSSSSIPSLLFKEPFQTSLLFKEPRQKERYVSFYVSDSMFVLIESVYLAYGFRRHSMERGRTLFRLMFLVKLALIQVRLSLPQKRIHHHESIRMSFQTPRGVDIDWH
ncbi:hypothetical protein F2Q68_00027768 [Brassica cretica]|uniref:Transmembrane protein n=1 Tax=Brassica cretica TaxID=69181 RepID=A0A8S9IER7_BRACR|nr:hypothetical protein F2Q68_00027768 [Brassica cretica]